MPVKKLLVIEADGKVEVIDRAKREEEYDQFNKLVGGYIQSVTVSVPLMTGKRVKRGAYVNEEGLLKRLPLNRAGSIMYGHFAIVGTLVVMLHQKDEVDIPYIQRLFG